MNYRVGHATSVYHSAVENVKSWQDYDKLWNRPKDPPLEKDARGTAGTKSAKAIGSPTWGTRAFLATFMGKLPLTFSAGSKTATDAPARYPASTTADEGALPSQTPAGVSVQARLARGRTVLILQKAWGNMPYLRF